MQYSLVVQKPQSNFRIFPGCPRIPRASPGLVGFSPLPTRDLGLFLQGIGLSTLPPGDPRHHNFSKLRGTDVLTELAGLLRAKTRPKTFHHRVLCGHRGSGKSTELRALKEKMDGEGFLTVWIEVDLFVGLEDLEY